MDSEACRRCLPVAFLCACVLCVAREVLERMMLWSLSHRQYTRHAALFLFAYAFMLRLPSEALPVMCGRVSGDKGQATLWKGDNTLVLVLARRKNKPRGSRLVRGCWCSESRVRESLIMRLCMCVMICVAGDVSCTHPHAAHFPM